MIIALAKSIRPLFIYLLLCIQVAPFLFTGLLYFQQYRLKQTAWQRLKCERLVCLSFSYRQVKGVAPGSEIKVHGKMMDVQSVSRLPDRVLVYGFYDEDEDELINKLATIMNRRSNKKDDDFAQKVWQLFMLPCTCEAGIHLQHFTYSTTHQYISYRAAVTTVCLPVATPPPLA